MAVRLEILSKCDDFDPVTAPWVHARYVDNDRVMCVDARDHPFEAIIFGEE